MSEPEDRATSPQTSESTTPAEPAAKQARGLFRHRTSTGRAPKRRLRVALDYAVTAAVAVALAFLVQAYIVKPYRVPTPSMANTVKAGERVLIDRTVYHYRSIRRGDIVAFRGPQAVNHIVLLKRVVGLPGDTLSLSGGRLCVNGKPLDEPYLRSGDGSVTQTLPATGYGAPASDGPWTLARAYTVPAGHYFMMGDNREDSFDSRFWGPIARSDVIGRAFAVYWPPQDVGGL